MAKKEKQEVFEEAPALTEEVTVKTRKKLSKDLSTKPGYVIIASEGGNKGSMEFFFGDLPDKIQTLLGPFGLGHKLGDAAAGRSGTDAEDAILKVWEGLKTGDWSVRAPATPKVSVKDIADNYKNLSAEEKAAAAPLLRALGIPIPA